MASGRNRGRDLAAADRTGPPVVLLRRCGAVPSGPSAVGIHPPCYTPSIPVRIGSDGHHGLRCGHPASYRPLPNAFSHNGTDKTALYHRFSVLLSAGILSVPLSLRAQGADSPGRCGDPGLGRHLCRHPVALWPGRSLERLAVELLRTQCCSDQRRRVCLGPTDLRAVGYAGPGSAGSGGGSRHHRRDLRPSYAGAVAAGEDGTPHAGGGTDGLFGERRCGMGNTENLAFWQAMPAPGWDKN